LQLDAPLALSSRLRANADAPDNLDAVQRAHIVSVLERCGWRINGAGNTAERLGIHPNTLRFRMKKLGVVCPDGTRRRQTRAATAVGRDTAAAITRVRAERPLVGAPSTRPDAGK
jgi:hypothetical protein